MLTLRAPRAETLWDELLPVEARELPEDLARIDELLGDPELLRPIAAHWRREVEETGRAVLTEGRPTIAMETYVRLVVVKRRSGWGYETLVREVSDSLHLRRFCLIPLNERVPDESTVRKLTRRLGADAVAQLTRALIEEAVGERRFRARALATEGRRLARQLGGAKGKVRDRSRAVARRLRELSRTLQRRSGERKQEVLRLTAEAGGLLEASLREARRLAGAARRGARGRGARAKLRAASALEGLVERCERVAGQIR